MKDKRKITISKIVTPLLQYSNAPTKGQSLHILQRFNLSLWLSLFCLILIGCQTASSDAERKYPVELTWQRFSVEYQALCLQTYHLAWEAVKSRTASMDKDWAVVLDVDETVLDNSRYQEILHEKNEKFNYYWDGWVKEENCPPVPGAKAGSRQSMSNVT